MNKTFRLAVLFGLMAIVAPAIADDWSQWLGDNRDSKWNETGIITSFPESGAKVLWRAPISGGYAGPAVVGNRVFVCDFVKTAGNITNNPGRRDRLEGQERVLCLDATTGKELWKHSIDVQYNISYSGGPRATPTVDGNRLYALGAEGNLRCINIEDGSLIWSKDFKKEYKLKEAPIWGFAAHPLVHGDTLFCVVGGEGSVAVAFDKMTGKEKWRALSATEQGYCPPMIIEAGGVEQLLIWHAEALNSLNPENGEVYWSFDLAPAYKMSIIAPIKNGDYLLTTALAGKSLLLKLDRDKPAATEVWRNKGVHPDANPPIVFEGHIYGVDVKGHLRCINLETGERVWESLATAPNGRPANSATAFIVNHGSTCYIANETGDLIIGELSPEGFKENSRAHIIDATTKTSGRMVVWSHPAFANKCVFARNDKEIVCVSLAK